MPDSARVIRRFWWGAAVLGVLVSCGGSEEPVESRTLTTITLELPALNRPDDERAFSITAVEYRLSPEGQSESFGGLLQLIGRGAAQITSGGATEVFRDSVDLAPGYYGYAMLFRDEDNEVILSLSGLLRVAADSPTELYRLFDPATFDPSPVYRPLDLRFELPVSVNDEAVDAVDYEIECNTGSLLLSDKRSYDCSTRGDGALERLAPDSDDEVPVGMTRWGVSHLVGCGPCTVGIVALDGDGQDLCAATLEFDVLGWGFADLPAEQVHASLCGGGQP